MFYCYGKDVFMSFFFGQIYKDKFFYIGKYIH